MEKNGGNKSSKSLKMKKLVSDWSAFQPMGS